MACHATIGCPLHHFAGISERVAVCGHSVVQLVCLASLNQGKRILGIPRYGRCGVVGSRVTPGFKRKFYRGEVLRPLTKGSEDESYSLGLAVTVR